MGVSSVSQSQEVLGHDIRDIVALDKPDESPASPSGGKSYCLAARIYRLRSSLCPPVDRRWADSVVIGTTDAAELRESSPENSKPAAGPLVEGSSTFTFPFGEKTGDRGLEARL